MSLKESKESFSKYADFKMSPCVNSPSDNLTAVVMDARRFDILQV